MKCKDFQSLLSNMLPKGTHKNWLFKIGVHSIKVSMALTFGSRDPRMVIAKHKCPLKAGLTSNRLIYRNISIQNKQNTQKEITSETD